MLSKVLVLILRFCVLAPTLDWWVTSIRKKLVAKIYFSWTLQLAARICGKILSCLCWLLHMDANHLKTQNTKSLSFAFQAFTSSYFPCTSCLYKGYRQPTRPWSLSSAWKRPCSGTRRGPWAPRINPQPMWLTLMGGRSLARRAARSLPLPLNHWVQLMNTRVS